MKKIRMIITSVVVLAIVGSAFTFKTKGGRFCILNSLTGDNCTTYTMANLKITNDGTPYKYWPCWDANVTECLAANNHHCTDIIQLTTD